MTFQLLDDEPSSGRFQLLDDDLSRPVVPKKMGKDANADFLRDELQNASWLDRNLAAFGTAAGDVWERGKQLVGQGDSEAIAANRIMREEAPVGGIAGQVAATALPLLAVGNTVKAVAGVGGVLGALKPVEGEQTFKNIATGSVKNIVLDAALMGAGQKVANVSGDYVTRKLGDLAMQKTMNAPQDAALAKALDAGLVVPPSSVNPTFANVTMEGIAGKIATGQVASNRNVPVLEQMMRKSIGIADDAPLTVEAAKAVRAQAYASGYKPIVDLPAINWDQAFLDGLSKLSPKSAGGAVKNPAQGEIDDMIARLANQNQWTGAQMVGDIQLARESAKANFRGGAAEQKLARAQNDAAKLLEGLAERNIITQGGNPGQVEAMRQARTLIAKAHTVEESILKGGGSPDVRVFANRFKAGKPLTDEQEVIGKFAAAYPKATQPTSQVAGPAVSKLNSLLALITGGAGAAVGGPMLAAATATAPFVVPPAVRSYLLGNRSQNALRELYKLGLPTRTLNSLLQYAPVGGTVLGSEALSQ